MSVLFARPVKVRVDNFNLTMKVSASGGLYELDGDAVTSKMHRLPVNTSVHFLKIPSEHPLQILGPSGDTGSPGRVYSLYYKFTVRGLHSMKCTKHGYMGGESVFDIY